ncbi:MAG TPA: dipeptidase [Mycetocola sp.]|nr:dipeptidase [Mycetocola sp.]
MNNEEQRTPPPRVDGALDDLLLIDGHNDLPVALRTRAGYSVEGLDSRRTELHTDIPRLREGRVGAQFWSVWVPSDLPEDAAVVATLEQVDAVHRLTARYPQVFAPASTADDVERVFASGRIASLLGIEGGHSIAESVGALRMFARLGVRYMTLTHNDDTTWAASATGVRQSTGLSSVGKAIVAEMNRIGMIVDLSHTAESTQLDALSVTSAPVIFSHSSARAVTEHPRNVSDRVLGELARNGGVVHITFVSEFVSEAYAGWDRRRTEEWFAEARMPAPFASAPRPGESAESALARNDLARERDGTPTASVDSLSAWLDRNPPPPVHVTDVADHVEHARDVAGIDHIALGGDFDGTTALPIGLDDVSAYPALAEELRTRGWSRSELAKLAGGNVLRVMRAVEDSSAEPLWPTLP